MTILKDELVIALLTTLGLDTEGSYPALEMVGQATSRYLRDLKIKPR